MSKITPPPAMTDENKLIGLARQVGFHVGGQFVPGTDEATLTRLVQAINQQWLDMLAKQEDRKQNFEEFGEGWESLAWELCAEEHGEEACSELIWEGGVVPEPWGDRWLKYEDEAKRLIALVHKHAAPVAQQADPLEKLTREQERLGLYEAPAPQPPRSVLVAIKAMLSRDPCVHANTAIAMIDEVLAAPAPQPLTCEWSFEDDDSGTWRSSCGELWCFIDGGPKENRVTYCHYCGGKVGIWKGEA